MSTEPSGTAPATHLGTRVPTCAAGGRTRLRRLVGRATAVVAVLLVPLVMQVAPAAAVGSVELRLLITASPSTQVGLQVFANLNLLGASSTPTGTATFNLFGPGDTACTSPLFVSTVPVAGTSVNSARFTTSNAGTYRWQASYSGDATYKAGGPTLCSDPAAAVIVGKAWPYLATKASSSPATAAQATATLNGGLAPTGTITFLLTGPDDMFCSGATVYSTTVPVNGSGTYDSSPFVPTRSGKYTWRTIYSGDSDNLGQGPTPCLDEAASQTVEPAPAVVDGGGTDRAQLTVFRPETGVWYLRDAVGGPTSQVSWGRNGDVPVPGDYNGDGRVEIAVYRPATGYWFVKGVGNVPYGVLGDIPVPADYNGDGRTDIAVWRPLTGQWFVRGIMTTTWGTFGDVPVLGDFNGDGKNDVGVYRPSTRRWMVKGIVDVVWGWTGNIPVPADYNGDGRTEIGVWRPSTGAWHVAGVLRGVVLGAAGDTPQPADYDGDGRVDFATYNRATGVWLLRQTTAGLTTVSLGIAGDVPTSWVGLLWSQVTGALG